MTKSCLACFVLLLATTYAAELKCPQNTRGTYPACKCLNGAVYDPNYNWCVILYIYFANSLKCYHNVKFELNINFVGV